MEVELQEQQQLADFDAALAPLERDVEDVLSGVGRRRCFEAFCADAAAFEFLVRKALRRAPTARNPLGLLVKIVADEHSATSRRLQLGELVTPDPCESCGVGGRRHAADCEKATAAA